MDQEQEQRRFMAFMFAKDKLATLVSYAAETPGNYAYISKKDATSPVESVKVFKAGALEGVRGQVFNGVVLDGFGRDEASAVLGEIEPSLSKEGLCWTSVHADLSEHPNFPFQK